MVGSIVGLISELSLQKQLDKNRITEIIQECLYQTMVKKLLPESELEVVVDLNANRSLTKFYRLVVEQDRNMGEISLEEARREYGSHLQVGDRIRVEIPIRDLEPKVVKNVKKMIQEKFKQLEEDRIIFDYEKQKKEIVTGKIRKQDFNGYTVDIGYAEALLPVEEQVEDEYYKVGDLIRCYVLNIRKGKTDVKVILTRTHPELVKKLFEIEVPEIASGDIEIRKIVREPGIRTKVCVASNSKEIDAAGSCLGPKGIRIEQIRKELHGEQIDIVPWDDSPEQFIANAIGSDLVERVYLAERGKFARVIVTEKNKNLAIGKKGKNVKLAAKLSDFKLDIFTEEDFEEKIAEERRITSHLVELDGMTAKIADILKNHGYTSVQDIFDASVDELCKIDGIGEKTAQRLIEAARAF
jgi:transcription termination/antitermination protein NusA